MATKKATKREASRPRLPVTDTIAKGADGTITPEMIQRANALRAEQKAPFPEDSADLIREAREQRNAQL